MAAKKKRFDKDSINLMVAVCAVLISAASFYATYVQSAAAERQVKAETWPYLQINSGNYDVEKEELVLYWRLQNAGVGPAHVKTFQMYYDDQAVRTINSVIRLCCLEEGETPFDEQGRVTAKFSNVVTGSPVPAIIPASEDKLIFSIPKTEANQDLWNMLDIERFKLTATGCYCSLLDECFETDFENEPVEVDFCKLPTKED